MSTRGLEVFHPAADAAFRLYCRRDNGDSGKFDDVDNSGHEGGGCDMACGCDVVGGCDMFCGCENGESNQLGECGWRLGAPHASANSRV